MQLRFAPKRSLLIGEIVHVPSDQALTFAGTRRNDNFAALRSPAGHGACLPWGTSKRSFPTNRSDRSGSAYCIPPLERIDLDPVLGLLC